MISSFNFLYQVDKERHRISLGMKDLYIMDKSDLQAPPKQDLDEPIGQNDLMDGAKSVMCPVSSLFGDQNMDVEHENLEFHFLAQAESRAFVPPLEVTLDDVDQGDDIVGQDQELPDAEDSLDEKKKKLTKKKARDER